MFGLKVQDSFDAMSSSSSSRKRSAEEMDRFRRAMLVPGASETACREICSIITGKSLDKAMKKSKPMFQQPFRRCMTTIDLPMQHGGTTKWPVVTPDILGPYLQCLDFYDACSRACSRNDFLQVFVYHDDATAGNVLSTLKQQKATLFYVSFVAPCPF